jgi:hypothetical protein
MKEIRELRPEDFGDIDLQGLVNGAQKFASPDQVEKELREALRLVDRAKQANFKVPLTSEE